MNYSLNAVSGYLFKLTFVIEIYLIFTNVSYVILNRKYCVPLLQQNDPKLNHYRRVAYLSRTLYLVCITMWNSVEFTTYTWKNMIGSSSWDPCIYFILIPIIYLYISVLCRVVFSWARSVLVKYSINLSYMWDTIAFGFNSCFSLAIFIWYLIQFPRNFCRDCLPNRAVIICVVWCAVYELLSFLLFCLPLKEAYRVFDSSTDEYGGAFLTANQQLDDMETGQDEMKDDHRAVLVECYSDGSFTSSLQISQSCQGLVTLFRKSVERNLLVGVVTIIVGYLQCGLYFLYLGDYLPNFEVKINGEKMDFHDAFVRFIVIILGLLQYVCMMLNESNWHRAFIPFWCWRRKSWTY